MRRLDLGSELCRSRRMRASVLVIACCLLTAPLTFACGSSGEEIDLLDPAQPQYGKTYAEWVADWIAYIYRMSPPECFNAIVDDTGAKCALYQDPGSPVFFLTGNYGGVTRRNDCRVPRGKALLLPIMNVWGDNAGVPMEMWHSDAEVRSYVEESFKTFDVSSLHLSVDGRNISHLDRGALESVPYVITLPAGKTPYDCMGITGVEGEFPGYAAGYWALLAPFSSGRHTLLFGARVTSATPANDITIDAGYELTVE